MPGADSTLRSHAPAGGLAVVGLMAASAVVHLSLVRRYGYHADELYFIECGRHLALGYVDHAPLIPWIARLADELGGASLLAIRTPAIAASTGTMAMIALLAREWGGGARAQIVALLSFVLAPAHLRLAGMLNIPVVEVFVCAVASYLVARALARNLLRLWPGIGAAVGVALLTKHTVLLWSAGLAVGIVATSYRRVLITRWPWMALVIAALVFAPNFVWQTQHGFPTLEFGSNLRRDVLLDHGRLLFVLGQLLYFHPVAVPVWLAGLAYSTTESGRAVRPFALVFVVMFAVLLVVGGKPYYLASAYPAILAAGGVALEHWLKHRAHLWNTLVSAICAVGVALGALTLPIFPLAAVDDAIGKVLGWLVPPMALTHDMHGELGWEVHTRTVEGVIKSLPQAERARAALLTGSYAQAAALNVLRARPEPRAVSGHMNYYLWGPESGRGAVLIAYGVPVEWLTRHYGLVEERARIVAPLARPWDTNLPVYVCREPHGEFASFWPELRRFDHRIPRP